MPATSGPSAPADPPDAGKRPPAFALVRERGEHAADINTLYNTLVGRSRSLEQYRWGWYAGPLANFIWTITETATQRIVGHHGIVQTPLVRRGTEIAGGRTENTIIDPSVSKKVFYVGLEKKALSEAARTLSVIYTVFTYGPHARVRARLGYTPVGRWVLYHLKIRGPAYVSATLEKAEQRLARRPPRLLRIAAARVAASVSAMQNVLRPTAPPLAIEAIADITAIGEEYGRFWAAARTGYDVTLDRSLQFLRWRVVDNPHLTYRTWTLRAAGALRAVVIGHHRREGTASVLEIDDLIVHEYSEAAFAVAVACLPRLDPNADAILLRTVDIDTPLRSALRKRYPLQARILTRCAGRLFSELVAFDRDGALKGERWYVTPLFTEGADDEPRTQRPTAP